jgi:hypothetical protein
MLNLINQLGFAAYFPLLLVVAMSFDAPGSGKHWTHWFCVISAVMIGPLCLIGYKTNYRWAGILGIAALAFSITLLEVFCKRLIYLQINRI